MKLIRCLFCENVTTLHKINAQRKMKQKVVTVTNAPVYYCENCKETFQTKELQDVFRYIKEEGADNKSLLFDFNEVYKKIKRK